MVAGFAPAAFAGDETGVIGFNPPMVIIDRAVDPPLFTIELFVQSSALTSFNVVDVVVGSNDGLELVDFDFDPGLNGLLETIHNPGPGYYLDDIKFGYFHPENFLQNGVVLGDLFVDTTGLPNGDYYLLIDWEIDQGSSKVHNTNNSQVDFVTGSALVRIIPEPATLTLLGLSLAAAGSRRRRMRNVE
jgi:hypothetical protein